MGMKSRRHVVGQLRGNEIVSTKCKHRQRK